MMDRNLGATSATPGDVGALGLLYQWGRKDPFLGSGSISSRTVAKSTTTWPFAVSSDSSNGTIAYATANPTTFIKYNSKNYDWYYAGSSSTDNTRWTTSEKDKSIYDPCPRARPEDMGAQRPNLMTFREIIEREDQNTDSIWLYREGVFMKAYERSAFFAHTLIHEFKLSKRYIKTVNMDVFSLGIPEQTVSKWLNGYALK